MHMRVMRILFLCSLSFIAILPIRPVYGVGHERDSCSGALMRKIEEKSPYVVGVETIRTNPADSNKNQPSSGSGIIVREESQTYILTNNHVVAGALEVWVAFRDREFRQHASVVGRDPAIDLALLSVPELPPGIGESTFGGPAKIGEPVYALGYPFGSRAVTCGYVTSLRSVSWFHLWTQAPVNPGNSGGPSFNSQHEVVGINVAIIFGATTAFVLPIEYVKRVLPHLIREHEVRHGSAGFMFDNASRVHPYFFRKNDWPYPPAKDGIVVFDVPDGSSAAKAGIQRGDIILKFNGFPVRNARDLIMKIFFDNRSGEEVVFTTQRGAQVFERRVALEEYISLFSQSNKEGK